MRSQREYELGVGLVAEHDVPGAFDHLLRAIQLDPENGEAHNQLGQLFGERHDYVRAESEYRTALRDATEHPEQFHAGFAAEVHNNLGSLFGVQERWDDAIREFRVAANDLVYSTPYLAWTNLGWALHLKGDEHGALDALEHAAHLQPDACVTNIKLGQIYVSLERFREAESTLTRVAEASDATCNHNQDAWHLRGEARARLGDRDAAGTDFERCVELGPDTDAGQACRRLLDAMH